MTISALANSMAMVRASFPSASTALMSAPRFRKRHTRLQWGGGDTCMGRGDVYIGGVGALGLGFRGEGSHSDIKWDRICSGMWGSIEGPPSKWRSAQPGTPPRNE